MLRLTNGKSEGGQDRQFKEVGAKYFYMQPSGRFPHEVSNGFIESMKTNLTQVGWQVVGDHLRAYFGITALDIPIHTVVGINTTSLSEGERYEFVRIGERPIHEGAIPVEVGEIETSFVKLQKLGVMITQGGMRMDSYGLPWSFSITSDPDHPAVSRIIITCGDNNLYIACFSILGSLAPIGGSDPSLDPSAFAYSIGGGWVIMSQNYISPPVILRFRTSNLDAYMDIDIPKSDIEGYWNGTFGAGFNWNGIFPMGLYGYGMLANQFQFILWAPGCTSEHSFMIASSMHPESEGGMMYISGPDATGGGTRQAGLASIHGGGTGKWYYETSKGFRAGPRVFYFDPEFAVPTNAGGLALGDSVRNDIIDSLMVTPGIRASLTEPFLNGPDDRHKYSIQGCFWDSAIINFSQDPIVTGSNVQSEDALTGLTEDQKAAILAQNAIMWQIYPKDEINLTGELSSGKGVVMFGQPGSGIFAKGMFVGFMK